ncbi:S1 family peptidase [Bdellovibrio svalbardensis]|uniref:Trypsin-like serine protease n=1 Tax=Bdellovibrio svalbardensis TaxID=2972972 RepID=A0ABT6DH88_9BACT|nr:trypsin-like serine protease [Bdellovibrio svalbardensis]MDG0815284.1 trypsin-like serine protease [Bdellovibrio svalbardensis]
MGLNKSLIVGVLSTLSFAACTPQNSETSQLQTSNSQLDSSAIIDGKLVAPNEAIAKSIVAIYSQNDDENGGAICTGSLLPGNLVLTAAHCVDKYMTIIFAPDIDSASESQSRPVDAAQVSPYWATRQTAQKDQGDIALIHFQGSVPKGFVPATFLTDMSALKNGTTVLLAGYGTNKVVQTPIDKNTYPDLINAIQTGKVVCDDPMNLTNCAEVAMPGSGVLRKTAVKIADNKHGMTEVLLDQTSGTGACHGDSGGPAYVAIKGKLYLWGVTSRGANDPRNDCSKNAVYTNAYAYKVWISQTAKKMVTSLTDPNRLNNVATNGN